MVDSEAQQVEKYRRQGDLLTPAGVFSEQIAFDGLSGVVVDLNRVWSPPWSLPR